MIKNKKNHKKLAKNNKVLTNLPSFNLNLPKEISKKDIYEKYGRRA